MHSHSLVIVVTVSPPFSAGGIIKLMGFGFGISCMTGHTQLACVLQCMIPGVWKGVLALVSVQRVTSLPADVY